MANLKGDIETFTDEIEGELEKHQIMGVPMTRRVSLCMLGCACVAVLSLSIGFGAMVGSREPSSSDSGGSSGTSTMNSIPEEERYDALVEILEPIVGADVRNISTPEYKAMQWLATVDPAHLPLDTHIDILTQRFVLATLYKTTKGEDWSQKYSFMSYNDVCTWNNGDGEDGVYCSNGFVSKMELDNIGLDGTLPESIGLLTHLEHLNMDGNELSGHLPHSITLLTKLTSLDLHSNELTGWVPDPIGDLVNLEILRLNNNNFTGRVRHLFLKQLQKLKEINWSHNQFDWQIHEDMSELLALEIFDVSHNLLTGTIADKISSMPSLKVINFGSNKLKSTIPTAFGTMARLTEFDMSGNELYGSLPSEFGDLSTLNILRVSENNLDGLIPSELGKLDANLEVLEMVGNGFDGKIPTEIGNIAALEILYLDNNELTGTIPTEFGKLYDMVELDLSENKLIGKVPSELGRLGNIEVLNLDKNGFDGEIPTHLANMPELQNFDITGNHIFGNLDAIFCDRPSLFVEFEAFESDCMLDELTCTCCTKCCDDKGYCCDNASGLCGTE